MFVWEVGGAAMSYIKSAEQLTIHCPHCATPMRLESIMPGTSKDQEIRTFICDACKAVHSIEVPSEM